MKQTYNNYAFIDGQNLNLGIQDIGWKLDFSRFRIYLQKEYGVSKAYYFIGKMEDNQELYDALNEAGYILIYKEVLTDPFGKTKGNIDAELVLQAMIDLKNYHKAVVVSGDGDFACLVTYLDSKNKLERVIVPNFYRSSSLIKKAAGEKLDSMNELKRKLSYRRSRKKKDELDKPMPVKQPVVAKPTVKPPKALSRPNEKAYKQPPQKQTSVQPTNTAPSTPKPFFKKFLFPKKKNFNPSKQSFTKQPFSDGVYKTQRSPSDKKQIPAKPTESKLPFHTAVNKNEIRKQKIYQNPFRYPDKEGSLFSKPLFDSQPISAGVRKAQQSPSDKKQIPAVPTNTAPTAPKKFFKKFGYQGKKNFVSNKPQFPKQTVQTPKSVQPIAKNQAYQKPLSAQPVTNNQTTQKHRFNKPKHFHRPQQKQTNSNQTLSKPTSFNQPKQNQASVKPVTAQPQQKKSFFGRFRFGGRK